MNVEMAFFRSDKRKSILEKIGSRIKAPPDPPGKQPDWGLPSSYDILLASEKKRKVVVSPLNCGWIALIESKEVLDFSLLQTTSETLKTDVVAIQLSDVAGACGYALCRGGVLQDKYFSEDNEDPIATIRTYLKRNGIPFDILTFREAIQLGSAGWTVVVQGLW